MGRNVRYFGSVSQTIQCVNHGKVCGTIHLQVLVVSLFNVDSITSSKTYECLIAQAGRKLLKPNDEMDKDEDDENADDTEEDDEIGDDTEEDDKIGGDTVSKDKEEYDTKEGLNEKQQQNVDHVNGRV